VREQLLHIHFEHEVKGVFALGHVQDRLTQVVQQDENIVLLLEVDSERLVDVGLQHRALGDERVDLLFFNLPADLVDQQRNLDHVVLVDHGVGLRVLRVQHTVVDI